MKKSFPAFLDFLGFLLVLCAAAWQIFFTDWFSSQQLAHHVFVSDEMAYPVLFGIGALGDQLAGVRTKDAPSIHDQMTKAVSQALERRDGKQQHFDLQSKFFSGVRAFLFILGSGCIVIGKYVTFIRARQERSEERRVG